MATAKKIKTQFPFNSRMQRNENAKLNYLKQTVHITCCSLVFKTNISSVFLGVPTYTMRGISVDPDLENDRVVLDVTLVRVQDISPSHVVRETPVILLTEEDVSDLP